ncbi:hypothetical protein [Marinifilum sp.]|uniref:hypothetical protein n=1 Tax=Marinifilum sp. TaxID=2033137 RepID=UPI003BAC6F5E
MILSYKTERLPLNFFMLGVTLLITGVALIISDVYPGVVAIVIAIPFLFTHSGLLIDAKNKGYKKYTGIFGLRLGSWTDLSKATHLQIIHTRETKGMAVLSIARNETNKVYKLLLMFPHQRILLISNSQQKVEAVAKEIAEALSLELKHAKS